MAKPATCPAVSERALVANEVDVPVKPVVTTDDDASPAHVDAARRRERGVASAPSEGCDASTGPASSTGECSASWLSVAGAAPSMKAAAARVGAWMGG